MRLPGVIASLTNACRLSADASGDLAHPDATQATPADLLNCHGNQHLIQLTPAPRAGLRCTPMGLVHLDVARQPVPARPNHRSAELVQPRPRRLVAPQAQGSLQPQGAHPTLLVGDPPHRPKPRRQRGSGGPEESSPPSPRSGGRSPRTATTAAGRATPWSRHTAGTEIPPTTGAVPDTPDTPPRSRIGARIRPDFADNPPPPRTLHRGVT